MDRFVSEELATFEDPNGGSGGYQLIERILALSVSKLWKEAKEEWIHIDTYFAETLSERKACTCGHYPIKEICIIKNIKNENEAIVGNCCILRFTEQVDKKVFKALSERRINQALISLAYKDNKINYREKNFLLDVWRKKRMTLKQKSWFNSLKNRIFREYIK